MKKEQDVCAGGWKGPPQVVVSCPGLHEMTHSKNIVDWPEALSLLQGRIHLNYGFEFYISLRAET